MSLQSATQKCPNIFLKLTRDVTKEWDMSNELFNILTKINPSYHLRTKKSEYPPDRAIILLPQEFNEMPEKDIKQYVTKLRERILT